MRATPQSTPGHAARPARRPWRAIGVLALLVVLLLTALPVQLRAEGSRSLYRADTIFPPGINGARANIEWRNSDYGGLLKRRTLLKVFAKEGEYVLLGSSAINVPDTPDEADIRIYNENVVTGEVGNETIPDLVGVANPAQPGGFANGFSCAAQRAAFPAADLLGRIASREQELAGPDTLLNLTTLARGNLANTYLPCFYRAPKTAIYSVTFWGPLGDNIDTEIAPTGKIGNAANNFNAQQGTTVAAWNVTVRPDPALQPNTVGRLFAYYLTLFTGSNNRAVFSTVYPVSTDGYRYRVDLNGMDGNGFVLYGNSVGFYDTDGRTPLYRDVLAAPGIPSKQANQLAQMQGGVSLAPAQFPFFFNEAVDPEALDVLGIPRTPVVPVINEITFIGSEQDNISQVGEGGTFVLESSAAGPFELVISRDGVNFDAKLPQNRLLRGVQPAPGRITIPWDGTDNAGQFFPIGGPYQVRTTSRGGEFHFPMLDVENSRLGGPRIELLNLPAGLPPLPFGPTTAYYDDRSYVTQSGVFVGEPDANGNPVLNGALCPAPNGNPPNPNTSGDGGFDSNTNQRAYGLLNTGGNAGVICSPNGSFGDTKGLDLWTYVPGSEALAQLVIIGPQQPPPGCAPTCPKPEADLGVTKVANQPLVDVGQNVIFTIQAVNNGPSAAPNVSVAETLPAGLTFVSAVPDTGTYNAATNTWLIGTMQPNQVANLLLTATVNAPGPHQNTVQISGDVIDKNPDNDRDDEIVTGRVIVDLKIVKTPDKTQIDSGGVIVFSLDYENLGNVATTGTVVTETVPANTLFDAPDSDPTVWSCANNSPAGTTCTHSLGTLPVGATGTIKFAVRVVPNLPKIPPPGPIVNTARIGDDGSSGPDRNPVDNESTARVPVVTAIALAGFSATTVERGIELRWVTTAEFDTLGYHLLRSADGSRANAVRVTKRLIPRTGRGTAGASYSWVDSSASRGKQYTYWLQEVEINGTINEYGPAHATTQGAGGSTRVYLPLAGR